MMIEKSHKLVDLVVFLDGSECHKLVDLVVFLDGSESDSDYHLMIEKSHKLVVFLDGSESDSDSI